MATRINNPVTLTHDEANAAFELLRDTASSYIAHANRTKSAAVRAHCITQAEQARALCDAIVRRLYTWKD